MLVGILGTAGASAAQAGPWNVLGVYPESTDATSRSGLPGPSSGDVLIEVRGRSFENPANVNGATGADFAGVGDIGTGPGTGGRILGFRMNFQDQQCTTSTEPFDFCVIAEDPAVPGQPGVPPIGNALGPEVLFRTPTMQAPGIFCWTGTVQFTATLATPADVLPGLDTWYFGAGLPANPAWTSDGLSIHMASFDGLGSTFPNAGDNPRDNVVGLAQARDVTNGVLPARPSARTHALWILLEAPVLQFGANLDAAAQIGPNPCYGAAGSYPDSCGAGNSGRMARYPGYPGRGGVGDGFALRVSAARTPNALGAVFLSSSSSSSPSGFSATPLYLGFTAGALVLDPARIVALGFTTDARGEFELTTPPASAFCGVTGRLAGQAAIVNTARGLVELTNGVSTSF